MGSKFTHVFSPIEIRGVYYKNRLEMAPPGCAGLGDERGFVTPEFVSWFSQFARGGVAVVNVGNCSIDRTECFDEDGQLDMHSDECISPLSAFTRMCDAYGVRGQLEINHNGATQGNWRTAVPGQSGFSPSAVITSAERVRAELAKRAPVPTTEMSRGKIEETIQKYVNATRRCRQAGMKTVMFHGAHGNLLAQFFSPFYNRRGDKYGGSIHNRARFAVELLDAVRAAVGEDFVIEYRISAEEFEEGHTHFKETLEFIDIIKDKVDILHVSGGLHDTQGEPHVMRPMIQPYTMPQMFNVHWAADIKKVFPNLIVTAVGSIKNIAQAEDIIASGKADFVAFVRAIFADPEMPRKYASGREYDHRPCIRCRCVYADKNGVFGGPCSVNPFISNSAEYPDGKVPKAYTKKKVAVIGGGPGGVQAMLTLVERGHNVTLYEKSGRIGGNLKNAVLLPFKNDVNEYLDYLERQCMKTPARVLLNTEATPKSILKEEYDSVVVAIGAAPMIPDVPGISKPNVHWAPDAESGGIEIGNSAVIVGAGDVGIECAIHLARAGKSVTIIEMEDKPNIGMEALGGAYDLLKWSNELGVQMIFNGKLTKVEDNAIEYICTLSGETALVKADTVLLAAGMRPLYSEGQSFRHSAPETDVFLVGDCVDPGDIRSAVRSAFAVASKI
jgi:2,4-dienoyl-CoA reductase-like NADH-dependent reductase (Old Yellow Enzyme family)/thioredoxin reductase